jgi:hypothetical protein
MLLNQIIPLPNKEWIVLRLISILFIYKTFTWYLIFNAYPTLHLWSQQEEHNNRNLNSAQTGSEQWRTIPFLPKCRVSNICWTWHTTISVFVGVWDMGRLGYPSRNSSHHAIAEPKNVEKPTRRLVDSLWMAPAPTWNFTRCSISPRFVKYGFET